MRNSLYVIGLGITLISCGSQNNSKKVVATPKPTTKTTPVNPTTPVVKPPVKQEEADFYKVNIADPTKNDNTISYGSIVSAKLNNYKVVKNYFPAVAQNFRQRYIILHYTALDNDKSVMVLTQQAVSAHYLVNSYDDNEIYLLVDENKRAYHAGVSNWRNDQNLNDISIGIEIVNGGWEQNSTGTKNFPGFPDEQVKKVASLVKDIATRYNIPPTNILAHSDIAPTRKQDPGPMFPWKRLYTDYQIGMWYDDASKASFLNAMTPEDFAAQYNTPQFIYKIQAALGKFGYKLENTTAWDKPTKQTIEAFQYHFRPEKSDGIMDLETWAILQALMLKYPSK
ncbi:N-acetylmuramoyl-L-alanine amidase [Soonwooa sp.]|uniref:N-acetylmuramoyl-L-alanine amidase n=1 Tax=Soonwooa sp. TaxID=1938592 RepID=UPI00260AC00D|nr:N-acetylmuramoyl-L-alanine amidase [Soonwooa sp.]